MYKSCKTQQSAERQQHIQRCMLKLMRTQLYQNISVCSLCEEAAVPRKAFYRYFENKEDVFLAIVDSSMEQYEAFLGPYVKGDRRTTLKDAEKIFTYCEQNSELLSAIRRSCMTGPFLERMLIQCLTEKQGYSVMTQKNSPQNCQFVSTFSFFGIFSLILQWHGNGCQPPPKEMAKVVKNLLTEPLFMLLE